MWLCGVSVCVSVCDVCDGVCDVYVCVCVLGALERVALVCMRLYMCVCDTSFSEELKLWLLGLCTSQ